MTSLTTAPIAPLLERLFGLAQDTTAARIAAWESLPAAEMDRLMRSKTEYIEFYSRLKELPLAVTREIGTLLYMLARGNGARNIVEFGTSFGVSTLHLAAALRDTGGGRLITCEFEPSKVARARAHLTEGGVIDLVDIREGDALRTLAADLPETIDLLLLDGAKALYSDILALLQPRLRIGSFIIADNADYAPDYLAYVRNPANGYLSVPFADEVELSQRIA